MGKKKFFLRFMSVLLGLFLLTACGSNNTSSEPEGNVDPDEMEYGMIGGGLQCATYALQGKTKFTSYYINNTTTSRIEIFIDLSKIKGRIDITIETKDVYFMIGNLRFRMSKIAAMNLDLI